MSAAKIKFVSAIIIACCFFLPLSKCQKQHPVKVTEIQVEVAETQETPAVEYIYPYKSFELVDLESYFLLAAFFWPVPFLLFKPSSKKRKVRLFLEVTQGICCLLSAYLITLMALVGTPVVGAYLAWVALCFYFAFVVIGIVKLFKKGSLCVNVNGVGPG